MEVTQPGPFKEAWYHDFAPPIHSLDRHGDFAPPLLALGLAAGFFGVATDDDSGLGGLQYNIADTYGPHNIGDWLDVKSTSSIAVSPLTNIPGALLGMFFHAPDTSIAFQSENNGNLIEWGLVGGDLIGYLGGGQDIVYTQGGQYFRNTGGADYNVYLSDGVEHHGNSGNYNVYADDVSGGGDGDSPGNVNYYMGSTAFPGTYQIHGDSAILTVSGDSTTTLDLTDTKTFTIKDHLGSPLVTYTG